MCGRYAKDLGEYARNEGKKLKELERRRKKEDKIRNRVSEKMSISDNLLFTPPTMIALSV